ncbi:MAG: protein kinase [Candidatus Wallbacteria bacterium]|nr:protein kinase [Candidatus Wallbacteria bacterium]
MLTDFGLAWIEDQSHLTQSGLIVGTGRYMAPEQVQGEAPGPLCDLYALGVTMWEYATGRLPFEDLKGEQLLIGRVAATLQPVAEAAPRVPPHLAEAIDRCVALRPADRFQGARELYRALRSGLGILDNSIESSFQDRTPRAASRRPSATGKMLVPTAATQPLESPEPGGGSHRAVAASVAMLVAAAALGAVAAVAVLRHRAAPAPVAPPIVVPPRTPSIASAVPGVEPVVTSVRPELPLRVAPESEQAWRAAVAVSATEVLVAWTCERSGLRFAASRDGGRSWQRLPPDPRLSSLGMTELKLVACEGRFHLLYYSGDDRKRVHLEYATATAGSLSFEAPRRLGSVSQSELLPALACARQRNGQVWLLAAWQSIGAGGIESAWSEDGGHSWSGAVRLPGSTTESRWPAAVVLDGSALLVWQQDPSGNRPSTLLVTRSSGPAGEWQPPRPLAVLSFGVDRCFPALASDGRRVHLQFAEKSLTGRGLVCTQSADGGRTFGSARQVGNWPCNDRHNALAARENRIWSTWEDKTARENVWAASSDGGRLWSREKELQPFVTESKPASIAVSPDGECWAAWASESGEVGAMRLP